MVTARARFIAESAASWSNSGHASKVSTNLTIASASRQRQVPREFPFQELSDSGL
jgi:hypothetical protein